MGVYKKNNTNKKAHQSLDGILRILLLRSGSLVAVSFLGKRGARAGRLGLMAVFVQLVCKAVRAEQALGAASL